MYGRIGCRTLFVWVGTLNNMNRRFIFITTIAALVLINGIILLYSKVMRINLQLSEKYEEVDLTSEIERMEFLGNISLIFLLILSAMLIGILWITKPRIK